MGAERMRQVYELARKWDLIILEDDAYFWLQYPQGADYVPGLDLRRKPRSRIVVKRLFDALIF
jgi:DNA-binding transcriptional MocR family regulator